MMAETLDTQHAKQASQIQSQVRSHLHTLATTHLNFTVPGSCFSSSHRFQDSASRTFNLGYFTHQTLPTTQFLSGRRGHVTRKQTLSSLQVKYKEDVQKALSSSLFSSLPHTLQTELAKEVTELQSQVTTPHLTCRVFGLCSCRCCSASTNSLLTVGFYLLSLNATALIRRALVVGGCRAGC